MYKAFCSQLNALILSKNNKVIAFDVFEGQNIPQDKKSVAINVVIQSQDKTLTESDLDQISQKIINTVKEKTGAIIRS